MAKKTCRTPGSGVIKKIDSEKNVASIKLNNFFMLKS